MSLTPASRRRARRTGIAAAVTAASLFSGLGASMAQAAPAAARPGATHPSDTDRPDLVAALSGYTNVWQSSGVNDLHGTVKNARVLRWDDMLVSWINQHATAGQQFRALQNSAYTGADGSGYDQSITIADGLGQTLGRYYAEGRISGKLPLTTALINSETGTTGAYVSTGTAKATFSHPRPYLAPSPTSPVVAGDDQACAPSKINASSQTPIRIGMPWADKQGRLRITRVAPTVDTTHAFAAGDVKLDPGYGTPGLCTGGSFPSGHTTTAYQAGLTLATLLPQLAPSILARTSEAGTNRLVLGVHYPLDIIGGRIDGEAALAARWSDPSFRAQVLEPARKELVNYLQLRCGAKLSVCIAHDRPYVDNPFAGHRVPGGSAQIVTNRVSAVRVYTERLGYGFAPVGSTRLAPSVPTDAAALLRTTFPTLTDAQRMAVLAQTETRSGNPLDTTASHRNGTAPASWQRLNLAAAMSATVVVRHGQARVVAVGGQPRVVR